MIEFSFISFIIGVTILMYKKYNQKLHHVEYYDGK